MSYQLFNKLVIVDQEYLVDNRCLRAALKVAQAHQKERERDDTIERSKKMPKRRVQTRMLEQLRALNSVLTQLETFGTSINKFCHTLKNHFIIG